MTEDNGEFNFKEIECSGALILSKSTKRILLLQKSSGKHYGKWGLVGGTHNTDETIWEGLSREIEEELSFLPQIIKTIPLEKFVSNDSLFNFSTYLCVVDSEFMPVLSQEHMAWGWFNLNTLPKPLHKALDLSLKNKIFQAKIQTIIDIIDIL
jgi:ADP-ribose pyrophosphatase YjhB (NUDIX family)